MPTVLVTGAGRGIGRAISERLARGGWEVLAGVRRAEDAPPGARPVVLDVTDEAQVAALDGAMPARLDALVNNAGVAVNGVVEGVALDDLRRSLEVNVVGQVAVTQALLPRLRASRGRIVFMSSVSGRVANPGLGPYNASKFALEAIADCLRMELRPWGIAVSLVEPTQIDTDMWRRAEDDLEATVAAMRPEHRELYARHIEGMRRLVPRARAMAAPAEHVAAAVERALTARRPRARYVVGRGARPQAAAMGLLPTPVTDALMRTMSGIPRRA